MTLLIETGIRLRELVEIKMDDLILKDSMIKLDGKGYKQRLVPIQHLMKRQLEKYIQLRGRLPHDFLFVSIDNEPISPRQVQDQIAFNGRRASLEGVRCSPDTFRAHFRKDECTKRC